ncbi:MAG: SDR family oxidoreductase [Alphaproteobacteria bacterium]|nr:SDR family oxidoreductase [Alphaproteobacteria bacterium]
MVGMSWGDEFAGRRVVITGACGIYGRWIATAFADAGAKLCLSDVKGEALAALAAELRIFERGGLTHRTDLLDAASIDDLVGTVAKTWTAADIVINNAGIYPSGFLLDVDAAEWDRIIGVNLRAPFLVSRGFAKLMIKHRIRGSIVDISSGASRRMRRTVAPYCLSKTALDRLSKGFAIELAEYGIRVNTVEPGFAPGSTASPLTPAHVEATLAQIPLGRASLPGDAPAAILFLCSSKAEYITGTTLTVDGGNSIGSLAVHQDKKRPG